MTQVIIQNIGNFHIPNEKTEELKSWLIDNDGVKTNSDQEALKEVIDRNYEGSQLLNG